MTKTMVRPSTGIEPDMFEPDNMREFSEFLGTPMPGEDIADPCARIPKRVRTWCDPYYSPGEVRHKWADDDKRKRPPKADKARK